MTFEGFTVGIYDFYDELAANNNREWWLENKKRYEDLVRRPLEQLVEQLEPEFGALKVFRPNRDVRFSADKRPYNEHASFVSGGGAAAAPVGVRIGAHGLWIAGGYWQPSPAELAQFRKAVDSPIRAAECEEILRTVRAAGFDFDPDNRVKTAPRGWSVDHPRIELLRLTSLAMIRDVGKPGWLLSPTAADEIAQQFRVVSMWGTWVRGVIAQTARA
jgi:uncharacterized protein (TIGR02453 family)